MAGGQAIKGGTFEFLRHIGSSGQAAQTSGEIHAVISFDLAHGNPMDSWYIRHHGKGSLTFRCPSCSGYAGVHGKAKPVLHQDMAHDSIRVPSTVKWSSDKSPAALAWEQMERRNITARSLRSDTLPVFGINRVIPNRFVHGHAYKPTEKKIAIKLFYQHSLAANRIEDLQQQGAKQLLRWNRWPSYL